MLVKTLSLLEYNILFSNNVGRSYLNTRVTIIKVPYYLTCPKLYLTSVIKLKVCFPV